MQSKALVASIKLLQPAIEAEGATALFIYGSRTRDDYRSDSDLDVFVDFDSERFGFVELIELEGLLSRELGLKVQLGTHDALHPLMKPHIERDAMRVL